MADNKVTIDVEWFDELRSTANGERYKVLEAAYNQVRNERDELHKSLNYGAKHIIALTNERDDLKSKLEYANKHYCTSATGNKAGDACVVAKRCQELETELENERFNTCKTESVTANRLAAAEKCIEEIEPLIGEYTIGNCYPHGPAGEKMLNIIRAWRESKEAR